MNTLEFTGTITEIETPRTGNGAKGEWANVEFEVTESSPQNPLYPQVGKFDMFKNGEYVKYAKDFETYYKLGQEVTVHFNLKKNEYTKKDGTPAKFYKTSAWKIEKLGGLTDTAQHYSEPQDTFTQQEQDDIAF